MFNKIFGIAVLLAAVFAAGANAQQPIKSGPPQRYTDVRTGKVFEYVCNGTVCYWQEVAPTVPVPLGYPLVIPQTQPAYQPPQTAVIPVLQLHQVPAGSVAVQVVDRGTGKYVRYSDGVTQSWVWFPSVQLPPVYTPNPYPIYPVPYNPGPFGPGATPAGVVPDPNRPLGSKPAATETTKPDSGPPKPDAAK